jgi:hypothetical protein
VDKREKGRTTNVLANDGWTEVISTVLQSQAVDRAGPATSTSIRNFNK